MSDSKDGFLVLTRTVGGIIRIGDDIQVQVLSVSGRYVKIGINAPKNMVILRQEIYIKDLLNREASQMITPQSLI